MYRKWCTVEDGAGRLAWQKALLNGQSVGPKSELQQSPELTDAHWQLIVGLKAKNTRPAEPMVTKTWSIGADCDGVISLAGHEAAVRCCSPSPMRPEPHCAARPAAATSHCGPAHTPAHQLCL